MELKRQIERRLNVWKNSRIRKPLIIRGARQVGKTTTINQFGKTYKQYISLNLERKKDSRFFHDYEDVHTIVDALLLEHKMNIEHLSDTLLFIDEIQEIPEAIKLLRYFYEDLPELHVIAAGSLLEFAMRDVTSFPVGRIQYMYMHPLNFQEYLDAMDLGQLQNELNTIPIVKPAHKILLDFYNQFLIIGGMPEIIGLYAEEKNVSSLLSSYEGIWSAYKDDVIKYARNGTESKVIRHIIRTAPLHLDQRITFEKFGKSNYKSREVAESFRALDDANIIRMIYPTTSIDQPYIQDFKKSPRMQFLDTGLLNYSLKIQSQLLALKDLSDAYKGTIVPHMIYQELISMNTEQNSDIAFWVREKTQSSAEVDLVYPYQDLLIPIEIKSGKVGKLRSLHEFIDRCPHSFAIRFYGGEYGVQNLVTRTGKAFKLMNLPYYMGTVLHYYLEFFLDNYKD